MAPKKRKAETYDKSDHFIAADDEDENDSTPGPAVKRNKTVNVDMPEMKRDDDGTEFWELSRARRVTLSDYKGKQMVSIREYYEKDSKWLPGKKGITMTVEQFSALITVLPQIETHLAEKGESLPRPRYGGGGPVKDSRDSGGSQESDEGKKANIEATSDEDED